MLDALSFKKFISLAVTDAYAGSDVAGIRCHAKRVNDGWVVNGTYAFPMLVPDWLIMYVGIIVGR